MGTGSGAGFTPGVKTMQNEVLLDIRNLKKYYPVTEGAFKKVTGYVKAVDDVSLSVRSGETLGIVGESGCGKTTLGKCIVRLHKPSSGQMLYTSAGKECDLLTLSKAESFQMRREIQIVFQDPYAALNPMKNILSTFDEPLRIHGVGNRAQREELVAEMLRKVNLQPDYMYRFPHEFSGGQRQRICIAKALSLQPKLVVCDEPVSALDVSIQAQILNLMKELQESLKLTYVFIAHDLSVVQYMSDRIAVMYLGKVVEFGSAEEVYNHSLHPYTKALLSAVPIPIPNAKKNRVLLEGDVPSPVNPPAGCPFHTRCPNCMDVCRTVVPRMIENGNDHCVACHLVNPAGNASEN